VTDLVTEEARTREDLANQPAENAKLSDRARLSASRSLSAALTPPRPGDTHNRLARQYMTAMQRSVGNRASTVRVQRLSTGHTPSTSTDSAPGGPVRQYYIRDHGRPAGVDSSFDEDPEPDFNILPWIQEGKLAWIAPNDPTFHLRWVPDRCSFLMVQGEHQHQRVQGGEIWS
jgi:hypothetical protein